MAAVSPAVMRLMRGVLSVGGDAGKLAGKSSSAVK